MCIYPQMNNYILNHQIDDDDMMSALMHVW